LGISVVAKPTGRRLRDNETKTSILVRCCLASTPLNVAFKRLVLVTFSLTLLFGAARADAQILHKKKKKAAPAAADSSVQPDKVLYDRAVEDIRRGRHETGRLNLQTLINTYPDSEYLAKAKLKIADSYYKEGGTANMTQAIAGYKDFIVFFPFLQEASYAQLQVAMGHYQQMEKPDRDRTEAKEAEAEFQTFLQKYPKDPLADKAMQHLREVQEVIAEGDFRVAYYYYVKGDRRAAAARLIGITNRYPLYSRSDRALWMLSDIFEKSEKKEIAANYLARIVRDYPLSHYVPDAKTKLVAMKVPIPQPDPKAEAWMQADQNTPRPRASLAKRPLTLLKTGPSGEMMTAARVGVPTLEPEPDTTSATDVLTGGSGSGSRIVVGGGGGGSTTTGNGNGIVATVTPGGAASSTENSGTPPAADGSDSQPPATAPDASSPGSAPVSPAQPESSSATPAGESTSAGDATSAPAAQPTPSDAATTSSAPATDAAKTDAADDKKDDSTAKDGKQKESSSKKKKGLRKIVPW
jgi:outer membrane protein assembly factor BamD